MSTVLLLGPSGAVDEIDAPKGEHAQALHAQMLASGRYREVERSEVVEITTRHGGKLLVMKGHAPEPEPGRVTRTDGEPEPEPEPKPRKAAAKVEPAKD